MTQAENAEFTDEKNTFRSITFGGLFSILLISINPKSIFI